MNDTAEPGSKPVYDNVIFALRKFTGGMGDEDEDQPDSNKTWMNYFLKPLESSHRDVGVLAILSKEHSFSILLKKWRGNLATADSMTLLSSGWLLCVITQPFKTISGT